VGDIQSRLGKFNLAETAYRRAITVFQKLAITNPTESRYDQQTAQAYSALGELMHRQRRYAAAVTAQQEALAIYQKRLQRDKPNLDDRLQLVLTLNQIGRSLARDRELKDAEVQMHSALLELDTLRSLDPLNSDYQHAEARIYRSLVPVLYAQQKTNEGQAAFSTCLRLLEELVEDYPYRAIYSYDLVLTIGMLPTRQTQPDQVAERASQFQRSVSLSGQLTKRFPQVPEYQTALSTAHSKLGRFLETQDRLPEAMEHYQQAFDLQQKLLSDFPEVLKYYFASAVAAQRLGNALAQVGELAQARLALETAVDNQSLFLRSESDSLFSKGYLYQHYRTLAEVLALLGESSLSREAEEQSTEIRDAWRQQLRSREERNRTPNSASSSSTNAGT
jgi:tetratricopeptide (TPR) repeat protein